MQSFVERHKLGPGDVINLDGNYRPIEPAAAHKPTDEIFTNPHRVPALVLSLGLTLAGLIGLGYNVAMHWPR